jgi:acetyl-CoA decarbonylase/synthase complex subunit gamma
MGLTAVFAGAFLTPALLPFIPFRSFAIKGWLVGLATVFTGVRLLGPAGPGNAVILAVIYLFFPAASSYIALQFTGATTFTGMSGVKKELRIGIPIYIGTAGVSLVLMIVFKLKEWGVI